MANESNNYDGRRLWASAPGWSETMRRLASRGLLSGVNRLTTEELADSVEELGAALGPEAFGRLDPSV